MKAIMSYQALQIRAAAATGDSSPEKNWPSHARKTQKLKARGKKTGRGPLKGIKAVAKRWISVNQKLNIEFSETLGGPVGDNRRSFVDELVLFTRKYAPLIGVAKWKDVKQCVKDKIYETMLTLWEFENTAAMKEKILKIANERYKGWRSNYSATHRAYGDYDERMKHRPQDLDIAEWHYLNIYVDSKKFRVVSSQNSNNRQRLRSTHVMGSKPFSQCSWENRDEETGAEPGRLELFRLTRTRRLGGWAGPLAREVYVMFSTDGYAFPETYYLGSKRSRDIVYRVLSAACEDGDLSIQEAIEAVEDIFRRNALDLYKLNVANGLINHETTISGDSISLSSVEQDMLFVRIIWNDASGQQRCRVVPAGRFYEITKNKGVGLTFASMGMTSFCDGPADGTNLTGVGEIRLLPDMSTLLRLPWSRREEMVMADMQIRPGEPWEYCPRNALRKVTKVLLDEFNVTMKEGFENEFYLRRKLVSDGLEQWVAYDNTNYCSTSAFDGASSILQEVYSFLKASDIVVEQLHAEAGKGQFEIALKYILCTLAADKLIYARETIKSVARKHGLLATFLPKPDLNDIGSGSHVHLSLWQNNQNVFMGSSTENFHGMSKIGERFLAGVYHHLPSILAFTAPHPNSYDRIQPNTWSGAYLCWGKENREAPLRTACPPGIPLDLVSNFEIKSFDACANPHLGLAAVVAAGIDGLRRDLKLPEPIGWEDQLPGVCCHDEE